MRSDCACGDSMLSCDGGVPGARGEPHSRKFVGYRVGDAQVRPIRRTWNLGTGRLLLEVGCEFVVGL
jgi:hypothetical protein